MDVRYVLIFIVLATWVLVGWGNLSPAPIVEEQTTENQITKNEYLSSPSIDEISTAIKSANSGKGVICIYGNYGGDVMNFEMAIEMLEMENIKIESIVFSDDVASASLKEKKKTKGRK